MSRNGSSVILQITGACVLAGMLLASPAGYESALAAVSNVDTIEPPKGVITAPALNVRGGPGLAYDVISVVYRDAEVALLGRNETSTWLYVQTATGARGWVASGEVYANIYFNTALEIVNASGTSTGVGDITVGDSPAQPMDNLYGLEIPAEVKVYALHVRSQASLNSPVVGVLHQSETVTLVGRTGDYGWGFVLLPSSGQGWVAMQYLRPLASISSLPVMASSTANAAPAAQGSSADVGPLTDTHIFNITPHARQIYLEGLSRGNQPNVFVKVGDSITHSRNYMVPLGLGMTLWGEFSYLQPTAAYFTSASYIRDSVAAVDGWQIADLFDGDLSPCPGYTSFECEYIRMRPSVAIIMIGTNDYPETITSGTYASELTKLVEITRSYGVIPVLSTIPPRIDGMEGEVNHIINAIAYAEQVPLLDTYDALSHAPNHGMNPYEAVHPSDPPNDNAADFTSYGLQFGYNIRNLVTLQALDALRMQAMY